MRIVASLLALAITAALTFTLTGCGGDKKKTDTPADKKAFAFPKESEELELKKDGDKYKGELVIKLKSGKELTEVSGETDEIKCKVKGMDATITWAKDSVNDVKEATLKFKGKNDEGEVKEATVKVKSKKAS